ncbi:MAG: RNA methyltransferase [Actinomycetota bacterium]|nr:RNA methyltransferase [Actinomycetota bacterium]
MPVVELDDLDDPRLVDYVHLREPSRRTNLERERGIFTVEGRLSIEALVESGRFVVRSLLVAREHVQRVAGVVHLDVPIYSMPAAAMAQVTGVNFHRGVLAVAERPVLPSVEELAAPARRLLVLETVNDHENIGSLFRNAAAFGVDGVVLDPTSTDPLYRRSTRVSLGHVLRVPFARVEDGGWPSAIDDLRALGFATVALTPDAAAESLGRLVADPPERVALLLGAEGPGLSTEALARADRRVRIPMVAGVDSVNVATAAAIALSALHGWD